LFCIQRTSLLFKNYYPIFLQIVKFRLLYYQGGDIIKIYISADIEGVSGVVHKEHTARDGKEHDRARMLMTDEINSAIQGAINGGASEIIVNDSHGTMRNIYQEQLSPEAKLILGSPKQLQMMEGIDETYDAALFVGYHTRMGQNGILNHTFNGRVIRSIKINDFEYGEFGLNSLIAGYYNVPVVFVSGCNLLAKEAIDLIPDIQTGIVKETINRMTALNEHPYNSKNIIKEKSETGVLKRNKIKPLSLDSPFTVSVEFLNTGLADAAEILPIVKREDPLTVTFSSSNIVDSYRIIRSLIMMADYIF